MALRRRKYGNATVLNCSVKRVSEEFPFLVTWVVCSFLDTDNPYRSLLQIGVLQNFFHKSKKTFVFIVFHCENEE